ncbi:unnamed protein product [Polarella glacialis]|nr:unnamed protein product [Polarella glacialis]
MGVFDEFGDTLCDVDPLLKSQPGFAKLSEALNWQFQMEDSLTSGYNNFVTFGVGEDAARMGSAIGRKTDRFRRHAGPGTLKSKAALEAKKAGSTEQAAADLAAADEDLDPDKMKELIQLVGSNLQCGDGPSSEEQLKDFMQKAAQR